MAMNPNAPATGPTLKYLYDLVLTRDATSMLQGMPDTWQNLFKLVTNYIGFIAKKEYDPESLNTILVSEEYPPLAQGDASKFIDALKKCPRQSAPAGSGAKAPVEEAGMYKLGDDIYKVQKAVHGSGKLYAKKLVIHEVAGGEASVSLEYAPGAIKKLSADDRLSLEEAREFGALYGTCCICGRLLTNELSIALGIGPVCGRREFGGDFEFLIDKAKAGL